MAIEIDKELFEHQNDDGKVVEKLNLANKESPAYIAASQKTYTCCRCGKEYVKRQLQFPTTTSPLFKATGFLPWCRKCVDDIYSQYRLELEDDKAAIKRCCMKMDVYYSDEICNTVLRSSKSNVSKMRSYLARVDLVKLDGYSYDNTLNEERNSRYAFESDAEEDDEVSTIIIPNAVKQFWGPGYSMEMYMELEERRKYWMTKYPDGYVMDMGEEAIIRQICAMEIDINHDRSNGKDVSQKVNVLNTLMGSANLKPNQKKEAAEATSMDSTPLGVGIQKWETMRPLPEIDPELKDVNHIVRYITVWFFGHLCKMLNIKNSYCRMYEEEMEKLRVQRPEFEDEDDEGLFYNIFSDSPGGDDNG